MNLNGLTDYVTARGTERVYFWKIQVKEGKCEGVTHQKSLSINIQSDYGGSTFLHFVLRAVNMDLLT